MGKIDDLTGQRFGLLTVETMVPERCGGYVQYACRCDCGQIIFANGKQLKRGTKKGCPDCVASSCSRDVNLVGMQYGELTVLERLETRKDGRAQWRCACSCGIQSVIFKKIFVVSRHKKKAACCVSKPPGHADVLVSG